ncbi:hypothetical protein ACMD2_18709 [Ananas comosus]|uniref:J domain-containing protein n=1 Tax=Ananas comosus TaxID=4615 RepID=A0A199W9X3_ANACO|nr:hypothetical protein ACMD2_18709 [Ananas comosus]
MEFHGGGGGVGGGGGGGSRAEAERWLEIAGKLLFARDLVGSKRFAERALESDPLVDGADQILAVADVLLASQSRVGSGRVDWYAVLGLPSGAGDGADPVAVKRHYRRLALLLHPDRNKYPARRRAPPRRRRLRLPLRPSRRPFRRRAPPRLLPTPRLRNPPLQTSLPRPPLPASKEARFGPLASCCTCTSTTEPTRTLPRCLIATARSTLRDRRPSPIVPGTNMYYCAWASSARVPTAADLTSGWKPFYRCSPAIRSRTARTAAYGLPEPR